MYKIIKKYNEQFRKYHNFQHILRMYSVADSCKIELTPEQSIAILFHDVYYVPDDPDNEKKSADIFTDYCFNLKATNIDANIVRQIILDTKIHIPTIEQSKIVIDLDLYGLGDIKWKYEKDSANIEEEFLTKFTLDQYMKGRLKWIRAFLKRDRIYVSDRFAYKDADARRNLTAELKRIEKWLKK